MDKLEYQGYRENKKHTGDDFPYITYLCSIPLDFRSVKIHWHDEIEFIIIKKGEGKVSVDMKEFFVKAGDIVFVPSGKLHSIEQKEKKTMEYENIIFKNNLLYSQGGDYCRKNFLKPILGGEIAIPAILNEETSCYNEVTKLFSYIDKLCDEKSKGYQLAVKGCMFQIMYLLLALEDGKKPDKKSQRHMEKLKIILTYIEENYQHKITLEEVTSCCFYSTSRFMHFFKDVTGMSFVEYLNNYRLEAVAKMLRESDNSVLNIAIDCGFDNISYFNRKFKERFKMTPSEYRKKQ